MRFLPEIKIVPFLLLLFPVVRGKLSSICNLTFQVLEFKVQHQAHVHTKQPSQCSLHNINS